MFDKIQKARKILESVIHQTPYVHSQTLNKLTGNTIYCKCENFQRSGSFKIRGAYHAVLLLSQDAKSRGIITHSSGNHGQAIALTAKLLGIPATIVVPNNAPAVKSQAAR